MKLGLIGENLKHSYSKIIHEELANNPYELISLNQKEFEDFMVNKNFDGINVTIPYKEKVIPFLDEIDQSAKSINAVNTIININGKLKGYNTDAFGFEKLLKFHAIKVKNKKILVLGTGGTAKTIKHVLLKLKAKEIYFVSRNEKKDAITYQEAKKKFNVQVIINATPNGMFPHIDDEVLIDVNNYPYLESVVDVIYHPFRTKLLIEARKKGCKIASGLYMLVAQAIKASELFFNKKYDDDYYRHIYYYILRETTNVVLIGMPASGKSTAGKNLAKVLKKTWYDVDNEIEKETGLSVREIFQKYGEHYFRELETQKIKELTKETGIIISTGGGSILKEENCAYLLQNGYLIFLNRSLSLLKKNKHIAVNRPILDQENAIEKIYKERFPLYRKYCDFEFVNDSTQLNTLNALLKEII